MHIRKLEIHGFKSFPDRTTFHFGPGISGVVGPNGCGKSNVVDAVKWCLGEQSAKSLRGQQMLDVIFAGSEDRPSTGLAEVTITFSSGDEPFPGEYARYDELQVTRRLFRSGQSEYLVNQQRVRLKDVTDLFLDSGAGNRLYSFIEQGRIGEIVSARPDQRRSLIEEAAGISRYKARRVEVQGRLDATLQNLERTGDVLEGLAERLKSLERQVARALRYRRLKSHIRQAEIFLGLASYAGLAADRRALAGALREAEAEEARLVRDVSRREEELGRQRAEVELLDQGVGRLRDRLAEQEAERREKESARLYQDREKTELERRSVNLAQQRDQALREQAAAAERRSRATAERAEVEGQLATRTTEVEGLRGEVRAAEGLVRERTRRIEESKALVLQRVTEVARARADARAARDRLGEQQSRLQALERRGAEAGQDLDALRLRIEAAQAEEARTLAIRDAMRGEVEVARGEQGRREEAVAAARREVARAEQALGAAEREEARLRARLESLEALQASHAGVDQDLRALLALPGVVGILAEHLDVAEALEIPLAAALGGRLDSILVPDEATALEVARRAEGRVDIVCLEGAEAPTEGFGSRIGGTPAGRAGLGRALGRCHEASDLPAALARWRATGEPCVVVGRVAGDAGSAHVFVSHRGEVRVGAPRAAGIAALARRRDMARAAAELAVLTARVAEAQGTLDGHRQALAEAAAASELARTALAGRRAEAEEAEGSWRDWERQRRDLERQRALELGRQERLVAETSEAGAAIARLQAEIGRAEERIAVAEGDQIRVEETLKREQSALVGETAELERVRGELAGLAAEVATLRERLAGIRRGEGEMEATEKAAARAAQNAERELVAGQERIETISAEDRRLGEELDRLGEAQVATREALEQERERLRIFREQLGRSEDGLRRSREQREASTTRRMEVERRLDQVRDEIQRIWKQLDERYELNVAALLDRIDRMGSVTIEVECNSAEEVLPEGLDESERDRELAQDLRVTPSMLDDEATVKTWVENLQRSRNALARLGEVNLVAVREYEEVKQRHDAMEEQRKDLEESVRSIRQAIARLNKISRERFRDTFDRVNEWFQALYPRLVGGGRARLLLTDEEDLLETGIDILVQPPGKRLQNLSLLSGGETAMVAIALIFSLFRVKPSPFCLLDEVDAPLDEGNGARFNSMLGEMAELSQFIVITHNKKTMECADTLYGVTMPSPGVSRLVSVRLD